MKKTVVTSLIPLALFAQSFMISNIPLPKTYIQNLDPYECDNACLQEYLHNDMIFSFLSHSENKTLPPELEEAKNLSMTILNIGTYHSNATLKIAMLLPSKKIGKYAASTTNAAFAYLMNKTNPFILKSYNIKTEDTQELQETIAKIKADGFNYIIAPLTRTGVEHVIQLDPTITIYFPTVNKNDIQTNNDNLFFGAIDYRAQSDKLLEYASSPVVIFSDKSRVGKSLANYQKEKAQENNKRVINYAISRRSTNLEYYLKKNKKIQYGSFIINTPIIKTSMILSQFTLYDTNTTNVLSTQINYKPLLLSMTQYVDRKKMIIANSLTQNNNILIDINEILDNDIQYDWINYTTTVGIDLFYHFVTGENREYNTVTLQNNQMVYNIELMKPSYSKFVPYLK